MPEKVTEQCTKCGAENSVDNKFCQECGCIIKKEYSCIDDLNTKVCVNMYKAKPASSFFSVMLSVIARFFLFIIIPIAPIAFLLVGFSIVFNQSVGDAETILQQIFNGIEIIHQGVIFLAVIIMVLYLFVVCFIYVTKYDVFDKLNEIENKLKTLERKD